MEAKGRAARFHHAARCVGARAMKHTECRLAADSEHIQRYSYVYFTARFPRPRAAG
eukprot:SAG22_NODE_13344_length_410_cov_0.463023_1_plen_55_part_10